MELGLVQGILEEDGIACLVKNQNLAGAMGEIPLHECWPELWIINDADLPRAEGLVAAMLVPTGVASPSWQCHCGEIIEGQFTACWNCGRERPVA